MCEWRVKFLLKWGPPIPDNSLSWLHKSRAQRIKIEQCIKLFILFLWWWKTVFLVKLPIMLRRIKVKMFRAKVDYFYLLWILIATFVICLVLSLALAIKELFFHFFQIGVANSATGLCLIIIGNNSVQFLLLNLSYNLKRFVKNSYEKLVEH